MQRYLQKRHSNVAAVDYNPGMLLYTFRVTVDQLATLVLEFGHRIHYSVGTTSEPER